MHLALQRAGDMRCRVIADSVVNETHGTTLSLRPPYRRTLIGLTGFDVLWLVLLDHSNALYTTTAQLVQVDEPAALLHLRIPYSTLAHTRIVDIKPYLAYCDAWPQAPPPAETHPREQKLDRVE